MTIEKSSTTLTSQHNLQQLSVGTLCKSIAVSGLALFLFYTFLINHPHHQTSSRFTHIEITWPHLLSNNTITSYQSTITSPTKLEHIVFGIVGSMNTWKHKRKYTEAWWRQNETRGYLFLDRAPSEVYLPWPSNYPPFRVNEDITKFEVYPKFPKPVQVRIVRTILETFREGDKDVRWYVMGDDDTVFFVDNIVQVLAKYDHTKYHYIGTSSECVRSNVDFSFDMAFGGAGIALSYPLVENLSKVLDRCIERYPYLYSSDLILETCLADIGVGLTREKGFHQIDLHGDISGLLSAHPQTPILSLHHIDKINPLFPSMNRSYSINHLMEAVKYDPSRLVQQTICFQRETNWTFSISWGYSIHVYENIHPRSYLTRPLETFKPWSSRFKPPFYMFNTRWLTNNPCEVPHVFFLESIEVDSNEDQVVTTYLRWSQRNLPACSSSGNHSADHISRIRVVSPVPAIYRKEVGVVECCDVARTSTVNVSQVKLRACRTDEIIS